MRDVAASAERIDAEAFAHLLCALPVDLEARIGAQVVRRGSAVSLMAPGADDASVNRTIGLGFDDELDDATLRAVCEVYASVGVPRWMAQWSPEARPRDERDLFVRHGGQPKTPTAKMWGAVDGAAMPLTRSKLRVEEVGRGHAEFFETVVASALGMRAVVASLTSSAMEHPEWHHYVVFDGNAPIAGAAMYVRDRGAYFGLAATAPQARGRGAQTLLLARRMADAKKLGCDWVTAATAPDTQSSPNPSYRNMLRAGMHLLYHQPKYVFGRPPDVR
jgi:GNAT superfamily N-acetyltransferase